MSVQAGAKFGPYEILSPIGAGGMGEVYKARDSRLNRSVAIKILPEQLSRDPDLRARFEREAQTLAQRLEHGPLPMDDALKIAIGIADALEQALRNATGAIESGTQ